MMLWVPFTLALLFSGVTGVVLYQINFIDAYGFKLFLIIIGISCFAGTLLGFSTQRFTDE